MFKLLNSNQIVSATRKIMADTSCKLYLFSLISEGELEAAWLARAGYGFVVNKFQGLFVV